MYVPNAVVKDTFQMDVYMHSYTYRNPTGFPGGNGEHIVKMSVIHVREAEMSRALNLHTAPSTEVPVCAPFVLLFLMMGISDRKILSGLAQEKHPQGDNLKSY